MFTSIEELRSTASADATFGEPEQVGDVILIPVSAVRTGFGMGFGQSTVEGEAEPTEDAASPAEGGGGGGAAKARPIAIIEVSGQQTTVKPVVDETKLGLAGIALGAWLFFWVGATVRAVFGRGRSG
jgi:uncharacterized spore protein YtfJ